MQSMEWVNTFTYLCLTIDHILNFFQVIDNKHRKAALDLKN